CFVPSFLRLFVTSGSGAAAETADAIDPSGSRIVDGQISVAIDSQHDGGPQSHCRIAPSWLLAYINFALQAVAIIAWTGLGWWQKVEAWYLIPISLVLGM